MKITKTLLKLIIREIIKEGHHDLFGITNRGNELPPRIPQKSSPTGYYQQPKSSSAGATDNQDAYRIISVFLTKNKAEDTDDAMKKYKNELLSKVGEQFKNKVYAIVDVYYNIDLYAPSGLSLSDTLESI